LIEYFSIIFVSNNFYLLVTLILKNCKIKSKNQDNVYGKNCIVGLISGAKKLNLNIVNFEDF